MDSRPVPPQYLTAGQEYLDAMISLGLIPAYLGWGWDIADKQWHLVMVTSILDAGGPLELNRLLFKAYNAKATPKEISPFIVRVFSPEVVANAGGDDFWFLGMKDDLMIESVQRGGKKVGGGDKVENVQKTFMGLELEMLNSYRVPPQKLAQVKPSYHVRREQWQRFRRNVERLAA